MTREEAIKILKAIRVYECYPKSASEETKEAIDMAIEALQTEAVQGVGRYENAMQKLREMPKYLNGVKAKQIKKIPSDAVQVPIKLEKRYPESKDEDITDAFMRGYLAGRSSADAKWIPCSERLPEKDDLVLVTVWNGVSIAWRNIYGGWESVEDMYEKGDVTAWMPLPKPYREDGE